MIPHKVLGMAAVRCVWRANARLGESPCWVEGEQALYWVDIRAPALYRYRPDTEERSRWSLPELVGCVAPVEGGGLVLALRSGIFRTSYLEPNRDIELEKVASFPEEDARLRFNDGKAAPDGSFWVGTMDDREQDAIGAWYRLSGSGQPTRLAAGFAVTNGPAFDVVRRRTYVTDSARRTIYCWSGWGSQIQFPKVFRRFDSKEGCPDGMTVDTEGRLWIAFWEGACLRALDPESGEIVETIELPVLRPTSCAFGGRGGNQLFVTSADTFTDSVKKDRLDGSLLVVELSGIRGNPPYSVRLDGR